MPTPARLTSIRPDRNDNDPELVSYLQTALISQGYQLKATGVYDKATIGAVHDFQASHIGQDGKFLKPDGWVGPRTWWAIQNPSGPAQSNGFEGMIPNGLSAQRRAVLQAFWRDHRAGVREIPDGSNWGGGVERYLQGVGPTYWCAYGLSTWVRDGTGKYPFNERIGLCLRLWNRAKELGRVYGPDAVPVPGDAFVLLYRNSRGQLTGQGHTGLVAATSESGTVYNSGEGNAGNRVKAGRRETDDPVLAGFVDLYGDRDLIVSRFSRGLLQARDSVNSTQGGTR